MDAITALVTASPGPTGPLLATGGPGLILVAVALPLQVRRRPDPMDRLRRAARRRTPEAPLHLRRDAGRTDTLERCATFLEPRNADELSAARLKLLRAGDPGPNAVRAFHFAQFALGIGFLAAGTVFALAAPGSGAATLTRTILSTLIPGAVGYALPRYWVGRRVQARREEIVSGFPDSLDMMLVCVEAGQSMDQAILRVAREIRAGYPAPADEYEMVSQEVKAGKAKARVPKDMGTRSGVPDVSNFVTVLISSAASGTSVAEALRVHAAEMRDKRVMRAEEKANTLPTRMTLVTMTLTVPPLLIILLGPAVYNIVVTLGTVGQ